MKFFSLACSQIELVMNNLQCKAFSHRRSRRLFAMLFSPLALLMTSCGGPGLSAECHKNMISSGVVTLKWARQMEKWYGRDSVDHSIIHFGTEKSDPCEWQSTAYLNGRFVLRVRIPIIIDYKNCKVEKVAGDIEIYFSEIEVIEVRDPGQLYSRPVGRDRGEGGWPYDSKKWKLLEQSNGAISSLPWKVRNNHPHPLFEVYRKKCRGDSVSLEPYLKGGAREQGDPMNLNTEVRIK